MQVISSSSPWIYLWLHCTVVGGCCWERKMQLWKISVLLLEGVGLSFSQTFQLHIVRSEKLSVKNCCQPCPAAPWPSLTLYHVGFVWLSSEKGGKKNNSKNNRHIWPADPTLERQEMSWTPLSTWRRKWICRAGAAEPSALRHSTTSARLPLCISWDLGSVFSLPTPVQVIAKFKPLRMKACDPCVIFKNCLKIRS